MNRRDFLSGLIAVLAAPVAVKVFAAESELASGFVHISKYGENALFTGELGRYEGVRFFNPMKEYGNAVTVCLRGLKNQRKAIDITAEALKDDARQTLPVGTKFSVIDGGEEDFGFVQRMAWYYAPPEKLLRTKHKILCEAVA